MIDARDPNRILKVHPNLLEEVGKGGVRLTLEGRLFALTLLLKEKLLTQEMFSEIISSNTDQIFLKTCEMLHGVADDWIAVHGEDLTQRGQDNCPDTNLNYHDVGVLMYVLSQSQKNFLSDQGQLE